MTLLIIAAAIATLILLITWAKFHPFLAFLVVSLITGACLGIPIEKLTASVKKGIGDMMGDLISIICLGAMLGKLVAQSGAAQRISNTLMKLAGEKYFSWAMMVTGFVVGIPLFYNVGFVLMVPLIFSVVYQTKLPAVYVGMPMLAALSVTHGFLPPHPSPTALVSQFHGDMGKTLLYGFAIAIPTIIIAGPLFAKTLKNIKAVPLDTFQPEKIDEAKLPGVSNSFISALLPVVLLLITTSIPLIWTISAETEKVLKFIGDPVIVMLVSVLTATITLGITQSKKLKEIMTNYSEAVKDVALILLIVAGAGALKEIFVASGVSKEIGEGLKTLSLNLLIVGWLIAAVIRVCLGSATVAGLTAAGIMAPIMAGTGTDPNLMVLSIGAGSLMLSHVNDAGFWMYKEYFNLSLSQTIRSWTVMETIVGVAGLAGVLILEKIIS
ncbi:MULTISPECIES: gluconate:H+ symporter [unclassified Paraflavitalea]|uniref:GntT/GntP/DsdX family permease n=1 Tax=unclassified Paraflavitalea TaxID=2798305 RepID=UPI003D33A987